jgi:hypothetical protein
VAGTAAARDGGSPTPAPTAGAARLADAAATSAARDWAQALHEAKQQPRLRIHRFHRYYGKLIPAIPATAIALHSRPGDLVLDPFCGSGTTLVEARAAQRRAHGRDVSPLAVLLSQVKATPPPAEELERAAARVLSRLLQGPRDGWRERLPDVPNRDHYYPPEVARDLVTLLDAARDEEGPVRAWMEALVSAINRDVSNADPHHVFPGVSKAMRARIALGWVGDVAARFRRALRDRLAWSEELRTRAGSAPPATVERACATEPYGLDGQVQLVVTNPPYLSSIRYVETFKLEAWWLGMLGTSADLGALDRQNLGTERTVSQVPVTDAELEGLPEACLPAARALAALGHHRMARVVALYARGLEAAVTAMARALAPGGHAVVKLAPSSVRRHVVPTPLLCTDLFERAGVELLCAVADAYDPASRTLTRARNWYSGRMDADDLLVFRKRG